MVLKFIKACKAWFTANPPSRAEPQQAEPQHAKLQEAQPQKGGKQEAESQHAEPGGVKRMVGNGYENDIEPPRKVSNFQPASCESVDDEDDFARHKVLVMEPDPDEARQQRKAARQERDEARRKREEALRERQREAQLKHEESLRDYNLDYDCEKGTWTRRWRIMKVSQRPCISLAVYQ
ncbi:hypothetical protein EK21DRAFT_110506 [Setomelanomma holmii]|uniref:Uncharacterized protein n=1 Tax=Setomelanomma holmii TaxID=210430 RepID=A0A9P4HDZ1_9PLEO|nr:hypothetical protein EK21DRAFT_110506 [Setomelanomma holmii]